MRWMILAAACSVLLQTASADVETSAGANAGLGALFAPALGAWITSSRDAAVADGVERVPGGIRDALAGHVPAAILDRVRWRVDENLLSVPRGLFSFGYTPAMTFDFVIVFAAENDALEDPKLWAHELFHVMQYLDWGIAGFAARYVDDYAAVERDAAEFRWQFMRDTGRVPAPTSTPIYPADLGD